MNAAIAIASRELRDRSRLFLIAAVMAVVPFVAVLTLRDHRQSGIALVAGLLAVSYSACLALILGISTIGRELSEKRAAFLFSTPVSPAAMWFGKTAAALLTCLGAFAIIILPTMLLARQGWMETWTHRGALYAILLCTALFLGGHVASTMLRSRSARIALDVAFLAMTMLAVAALFRPLLRVGAGDVALKLLIGMGIALMATLVIAPVWQLARGRIDPRSNHAALSTVVWSGVAVILVVAAAYVMWVISPPLSALAGFHALDQSPNGSWVFVSGPTHGRGSFVASYLVNTVTGERERLSIPPMTEAHFSDDGRMVAWLENTALFPRVETATAETRDLLQRLTEQQGKGAFRLYTRRLENGATSVATPLVVPMPHLIQLSHDGTRVAMASGTRIEVYEVVSGRLLATAEGVSAWQIAALIFERPELLRIVDVTMAGMRIQELDIARRALTMTAKRAVPRFSGVTANADGSRIYLRYDAVVLDARTGAPLAPLPVKPQQPIHGTILGDGSVVVTRDAKLFHIDTNGRIAGEVPLPMPNAGVVAQIGAAKVMLSGNAAMVIVDLVTKKVTTVPPGTLRPRLGRQWFVVPRFTDDAAIVGIEHGPKLMLWDVRTGAKRAL